MDRGYDREFIIVDKTKLSGEEDQFKDATVFYHHPQKTMAEVGSSDEMHNNGISEQTVGIYACLLPHAVVIL